MGEEPREHRESRVMPEMVRDVGGSVVSAAIGLWLGGPGGAVLGAAAGGTASVVADLVTQAVRTRAARMTAAFDRAAQLSGLDAAGLEESILKDEERLDFAMEALSAASTAGFDGKVGVLASAIAEIPSADALRLQRLTLMVRSIENMTELHARVIATLEDGPEEVGTPSGLAAALRIPTHELRPVVRELELHGLIVDANRFISLDEPRWEIAELGQLVIKLLRTSQAEPGDNNGK